MRFIVPNHLGDADAVSLRRAIERDFLEAGELYPLPNFLAAIGARAGGTASPDDSRLGNTQHRP